MALRPTVRAGAVRDKLGELDCLPSVDEAHANLVAKIDARLRRLIDEQAAEQEMDEREFSDRLLNMRHRQRQDLNALMQAHQLQRRDAARQHSSRRPTGLKALWFRMTRQYVRMKLQMEGAIQRQADAQNTEKEMMIRRQSLERRVLQRDKRSIQQRSELLRVKLRREISGFQLTKHEQENSRRRQTRPR